MNDSTFSYQSLVHRAFLADQFGLYLLIEGLSTLWARFFNSTQIKRDDTEVYYPLIYFSRIVVAIDRLNL